MGIKIGKNTLLAGNTVLNTGEQVNVSRAAAGDTKAPLAMAVTSSDNSPAYDPTWLNDNNGIVNVAMVKKLIEMLASGLTEEQINTIVNLHNSNAAAHSSLFSEKLDKPAGGTTGQVLTKTESGATWSSISGGSAFDDVFTVAVHASDYLLETKETKKTTLSSGDGWNILANGDVYICSYASDLMLSGGRVSIGTSHYVVFDANGDNVSITAQGIMTLSDSTGSYTLSDLAGSSVSYQTKDGTGASDWYNVTVAAGWYKVDVLLRSSTDQSVNYNVFRYMASNMKAVRCVAWSNSGAPSVLIEPSAGFLPNITTCRVLQMSFLWLAPGGKQDWAGTDITKFDWGSITYTAIPTPTRITS